MIYTLNKLQKERFNSSFCKPVYSINQFNMDSEMNKNRYYI